VNGEGTALMGTVPLSRKIPRLYTSLAKPVCQGSKKTPPFSNNTEKCRRGFNGQPFAKGKSRGFQRGSINIYFCGKSERHLGDKIGRRAGHHELKQPSQKKGNSYYSVSGSTGSVDGGATGRRRGSARKNTNVIRAK